MRVHSVDLELMNAADIEVKALSDLNWFSEMSHEVGNQLILVFASQLDAILPPNRPYDMGDSRVEFAQFIRECRKKKVQVRLSFHEGKGLCLEAATESGFKIMNLNQFMNYLLDHDHETLWTSEWQYKYATVIAGSYFESVNRHIHALQASMQKFFGHDDYIRALAGVI